MKNSKAVDQNAFHWKSLINKSDAEFEALFNNLKGLDAVQEKFTPNELGELRNMFARIDEIVEVIELNKENLNKLKKNFKFHFFF